MVYAGGKVTEPFFAALARDERCFYMINAVDLWEKMKWQVQAEQMHSKALAPGPLSPTQIVSKYKVFIP